MDDPLSDESKTEAQLVQKHQSKNNESDIPVILVQVIICHTVLIDSSKQQTLCESANCAESLALSTPVTRGIVVPRVISNVIAMSPFSAMFAKHEVKIYSHYSL